MKWKSLEISLSVFLLLLLSGLFSVSTARQKSECSMQKLQVVTLKITGMT
ncbi:hypothetical protein BMS3Abin05_00823 [bacterium BMS3Abin05]|nr:hypothetical protein BMS3Abin05_00823 [bacterium BMS3Abin05]GBE28760.1 hypothetical protein BMS3Bbin03_02711 [bacterium BMS3Bbin03]